MNRFIKYIEDNYYNEIFATIKRMVVSSRKAFHSIIIDSVNYAELDDIRIKSIRFLCSNDRTDTSITFNATVQAEIIVSGMGRKDYEYDRLDSWYSVKITADLSDGFNNFRIVSTEEYSKAKYIKEEAVTKYLAPYMYSDNLDDFAEEFLLKIFPEALDNPIRLPVDKVLKSMGLSLYYAPLSNNVFGKTFFADSIEKVFNENHHVIETLVTDKTILVNPNVFFMRDVGSINNTIIHECVHQYFHRKFFFFIKLFYNELDYKCIQCETAEKKALNNDISKALAWIEWQANVLAPRILMPAKPTGMKISRTIKALAISRPELSYAERMEIAISDLAEFYGVSKTSMKIRAMELGFEQASGVLNYVDGNRCEPISFKTGSLKRNETFFIDERSVINLNYFDKNFNKLTANNRFIHFNGLLILNSPKFVFCDGEQLKLTPFAKDHAEQCCLKFSRNIRTNPNFDNSYYSLCSLCRDADAYCYIEQTCNLLKEPESEIFKNEDELKRINEELNRIIRIQKELPATFADTLDFHINRTTFSNERIAERCELSDKTIRELRKGRSDNPSIGTVLALCIGLNLHPEFSYDLIEKAGYNINKPSKENAAYKFLINYHHMESLRSWNETLARLDLNISLPK